MHLRPDHQDRPADSIRETLETLGVSFASPERLLATLPFSRNDVTAGSESELQAVVCGSQDQVDLPLIIEHSNFFANIMKRAASGEAPKRAVADLERFLADNSSGVWENSWVRFPLKRLSSYAQDVLDRDLLAHKQRPELGRRSDADRFFFRSSSGEEMLRLPISYLLKLALADLIGSHPDLPPLVRRTAERLMGHFLNDNTSPETFSFNVVSLTAEDGMGSALAQESALRFLMTQLLIQYANDTFGLRDHGQTAMIYAAPHPPVRQKELNTHVSDSFYRELFMSPCLSGWDDGEAKFHYMHLCHQVLSRSQLNAVAKLKEAGIILNNLVVLPNLSNVSLANNGIHISIGSRRISRAMADPASGFGPAAEKQLGDLTIKITEHFLPLFVGTYTAAPYRLDFTDFHPEKALGYLPHELDYTHLRMMWRRWKKKATISILGRPLTPFGPEPLDRFIGGLFGLRGDFVPDFRLIDYLVCLLSTERSPALNGVLGNHNQLRRDLAEMGVFDDQMSVYLLYKLREHAKMGFSGFEGRYYSQFDSFVEDMGQATNLQTLITALAHKYMAKGIHHGMIPDTASVESERRQIFFGAAVGIPTFFVRKDTPNTFLATILAKTKNIRPSRRYPGYLRVPNHEYRLALLATIREDAADLVELLGLEQTLIDLEQRLTDPERYATADRLTSDILDEINVRSPLHAAARDFNVGAERFYRTTLRRRQMKESLEIHTSCCRKLDQAWSGLDDAERSAMGWILQGQTAARFAAQAEKEILNEQADRTTICTMIQMILLTVHHNGQIFARDEEQERRYWQHASPPVYRAI